MNHTEILHSTSLHEVQQTLEHINGEVNSLEQLYSCFEINTPFSAQEGLYEHFADLPHGTFISLWFLAKLAENNETWVLNISLLNLISEGLVSLPQNITQLNNIQSIYIAFNPFEGPLDVLSDFPHLSHVCISPEQHGLIPENRSFALSFAKVCTCTQEDDGDYAEDMTIGMLEDSNKDWLQDNPEDEYRVPDFFYQMKAKWLTGNEMDKREVTESLRGYFYIEDRSPSGYEDTLVRLPDREAFQDAEIVDFEVSFGEQCTLPHVKSTVECLLFFKESFYLNTDLDDETDHLNHLCGLFALFLNLYTFDGLGIYEVEYSLNYHSFRYKEDLTEHDTKRFKQSGFDLTLVSF